MSLAIAFGRTPGPQPAPDVPPQAARWLPRLVIHAYHQRPGTAETLRTFAADRRLARCTVEIQDGGMARAIARYREEPSPDLLIVECGVEINALRASLDALADTCLPHTRLLLVGETNDIRFYRTVVACGASDYLAQPVEAAAIVEAVTPLFGDRENGAFGTTVAFIGTRGGAGASTVALGTASTLAYQFGRQVILADLDPAGALDIAAGIKAEQTAADVLKEGPRLDAMLLDRVLKPVQPNLNLLPASAASPMQDTLSEDAVVRMVEVARSAAGFVALDLPGGRASTLKTVLQLIDKVVLVAEPDLVSLRNARAWHGWLSQARGDAASLHVVLNKTSTPKRLEILPQQFADALGGCRPIVLPFAAWMLDSYSGTGELIHQKRLPRSLKNGLLQVADAISGRGQAAPTGRWTWLRRGRR